VNAPGPGRAGPSPPIFPAGQDLVARHRLPSPAALGFWRRLSAWPIRLRPGLVGKDQGGICHVIPVVRAARRRSSCSRFANDGFGMAIVLADIVRHSPYTCNEIRRTVPARPRGSAPLSSRRPSGPRRHVAPRRPACSGRRRKSPSHMRRRTVRSPMWHCLAAVATLIPLARQVKSNSSDFLRDDPVTIQPHSHYVAGFVRFCHSLTAA